MEKIVMFDFDGVIADSLQQVRTFVNKHCEKVGLCWFTKRVNFTNLFDGNFYEQAVKFGFPESKIDGFISDYLHEFNSEIDTIKIFPEMKDAIAKIAETSQVYVITSSITSVVRGKIESEEILNVREVIGADLEKSKVKKIERVKLLHPAAEYYYIGDTTGDISEAKKAKVKSIAVTWGYHTRKKLLRVKPDFIADSPAELLNILSGKTIVNKEKK